MPGPGGNRSGGGWKRPASMAQQPNKRAKTAPATVKLARHIKDNVCYFKRTLCFETWTPSTITTADFWRYYRINLAQLPSAAEFAALFDQYKINGLKFTFRPRYSEFAGNDTTDTTLPGVTNQGQVLAHVIVDPHNVSVPSGTYTRANLNTFLENGNVKSYQANKPFSVYYKPTVDTTVQSVGSARRIAAPWLQTTQLGIDHNGFHMFLSDVNLTGAFGNAYDVFVTYYFCCRNQR